MKPSKLIDLQASRIMGVQHWIPVIGLTIGLTIVSGLMIVVTGAVDFFGLILITLVSFALVGFCECLLILKYEE